MRISLWTRFWYTLKLYREKQQILVDLTNDNAFYRAYSPELDHPEEIAAIEAELRALAALRNPTGELKEKLKAKQKQLNQINYCRDRYQKNQEVIDQLKVYLPLMRANILRGQFPPASL